MDQQQAAGFDVVEPRVLAPAKFKDRKYRLNGNVWLIVSVYRNAVCIHVRELKDGWKFEGGVSMNVREYQWFTREDQQSSGEFGRISVAKQKTGSLVKRIDARMGSAGTSKPRSVVVSNNGFATLIKEKNSIMQDIDEAKKFAESRDVLFSPNHHLIQNILILLATKIYEQRRRAACLACAGQADASNLLNHACLDEDDEERIKRAGESLDAVPSRLLWSVLASNEIPHLGLDVAAVVGDQRKEMIENIVKYKFSSNAQVCFDLYYNANFDIMKMDNNTWEPSQYVME